MLPEIPGGCVRYDKVAFVLLAVGGFCFVRFLRFQSVPHIFGLGELQHIALQFLFALQRRFNGFQFCGAVLEIRIGGGNGCVKLLRGSKAVLLIGGNGSRHLFEVVDCRPAVIAHAFPLGSLGFPVNHALYAVLFRGGFRCFSLL